MRSGGGGGAWTSHQACRQNWGKVRPSSPNKRKNLGNSATTRRKSWEKVPILGSYMKVRGQNLGYLSLIFLEAKFGAPTRISEVNFGAKPPRPPNIEVPPGLYNTSTALEEKNKESVATKKSQLQLKHIK